jgi:LysR family glycine cleavage system transcriptional activator
VNGGEVRALALPDLESLRCFEAAAVTLNFRRAAAAVTLSPTAFSGRIRRLEEHLGYPLFMRTTRQVSLTRAGQALRPQVQRVLDNARRCLSLGREELPFELTVGTRYELGVSWLTPALGELRRARPERTVHLSFGESEDLLARLRNGHLDCAVSCVRLASGGVRYEQLHREDHVLVGAPELLAARPLREAADAPAHTLLDTHPELPLFRYLLDARPPGEGWRFQTVERLGVIAAVRHRALEGAGVAVLPEYYVRADLAAGRLEAALPNVRLVHDHFRLIWRSGHQREDELRELARELRAVPLVTSCR